MGKLYALNLFFFFFLFVCNVLSQEPPVKHISGVVVESNKKFFSDDHTVLVLDLKSIRNDHQNISYALGKSSPALIRNYGSTGSIVSVTLNGTGSNHTQVCWNGIPLNSPTTGQADLSLIPSSFIQNIEVITGASGSSYGSGTFGGSINLNNEADWNNLFTAEYSLNVGSYGKSGHRVLLRAGGTHFQYQLSAINSKSENNFSYKDYYRYEAPVVKNHHNAYKDIGIMQNMFLKFNKNNFLESGLWYQEKYYELPALMGSYKRSNATQRDSLFRSYINYRRAGNKFSLVLKSAYFSDFLNYRDKALQTDTFNSLDSRIATSRFINEADYRYFISTNMIAGIGASYNRLSGNSNNYGRRINENEYAIYAHFKIVLKQTIISAGIRKQFYEKGMKPAPQYSLGIRFKPYKNLIILSSISNKFRKPTFNEKYWKPGGNSKLNPEKGWGGEITTEWKIIRDPKSSIALDARLTGYYQTVANWIQWLSIDSLTPVEYKKVNVSGMNSGIDFAYILGLLKINGHLNYNYNRSVVVNTYDDNKYTEGKQLIYVPKHALRSSVDMELKNYMLGFSLLYTGTRETTETNDLTYKLPSYTVASVMGGYNKQFHNVRFALFFAVDNLFNNSYEIVRSYPLPGRTFHFTVSVGFSKFQTNNNP